MTPLVLTLAETLHINEIVYYITSRISTFFEYIERTKKVNQTIRELNELSDAELSDIGINRGMIYSIAMESHYGDTK